MDAPIKIVRDAPIWTPEAAEVQSPLIVSATQWKWRDPKSIPRRQWLYGWHLIRKFGSAKIAPPGIGKSSLALTEAVAMASDRPLLGISPRRRCPSGTGTSKTRKEELDRRIPATASATTLRRQNSPAGSTSIPGETGNHHRPSVTRDGATILAPVATAVERTIKQRRIDVLTVDPFISSHRVTENDNNAIDLVAKGWAGLPTATN